MAAEPERIPRATYRIQLRRDFGFARARDLVDYLARLGVSDLYVSPIFQARPESTHGYDVIDPRRLDPRFGPEADFEELTATLDRAAMGLLLDIVPNHMAASPANPWFRDVLEKGVRSPFAKFFDIDWTEERTLVPVLGEPLEEAVENGRLTLELSDRGLMVRYFDKAFPLDPASYADVLAESSRGDDRTADHDPARADLARLLDRMAALPPATEAAGPETTAPGARREAVKRRLLELYRSRETLREIVDERIVEFNDTSGDPARLIALLERQAFRLAFWREASRNLNYRRFFNISDLIGVRVEEADVFEATHARILALAGEGRVTGLRVDHVDGLYDPEGYLRRLQTRLAGSSGRPGRFFVVVEKILCPGEAMPREWPVAGTTGYDFAGDVHAVFLDAGGLDRLRRANRRSTGRTESRADLAYRQKRRILRTRLESETRSLARALQGLLPDVLQGPCPAPAEIEHALIEITSCLPVYRTYVRGPTVDPRDLFWIRGAIAQARRRRPGLALVEDLGRILRLDFPAELAEQRRAQWLDVVQRWQQYTPPAMAKGVEDTVFYLDNALVSLNEVGSAGEALSPEEFHRRQIERRRSWPDSLSAASTHDTKRSEDVRARIGALTELAEEWVLRVERWRLWNAPHQIRSDGRDTPDASEEALLYQNLAGAWPLREDEEPGFRARFEAFLIKALREAKAHTRWTDPNLAYEKAVTEFAAAVLEPGPENRFLDDFRSFQGRLAPLGAIVSLSQTLVKIAAPGVADFYQGTELWDFSLVDPDNRRPVDFDLRRRLLDELDREEAEDREALLRNLRESWQDGRIKLFLVSRALRARKADADLFARGDYTPLSARPDPSLLVAFTRQWQGRWILAACPRHAARRLDPSRPLGFLWPGSDCLPLPEGAPIVWRNLLTGKQVASIGSRAAPALAVGDLLQAFPVALLAG